MKLKKVLRKKGIDYSGKSDEEEEEFPNEECPDEEFQGGLKVPGTIWHKLFRFPVIFFSPCCFCTKLYFKWTVNYEIQEIIVSEVYQ